MIRMKIKKMMLETEEVCVGIFLNRIIKKHKRKIYIYKYAIKLIKKYIGEDGVKVK